MKEANNILRILQETLQAVKENNAQKILQLSDQTINTAAFTQDPDNITVAVIIYSLGKIFERERYKQFPQWKKFYSMLILHLEKSISDIEQNKEEAFRKDFEDIREKINQLSGKLKKYIQEVFEKAKISKASRIYEHGVSMEQTAKLLGITIFELAEYAGQTGISDVKESRTMDVKQRIKFAEEMFA